MFSPLFFVYLFNEAKDGSKIWRFFLTNITENQMCPCMFGHILYLIQFTVWQGVEKITDTNK